jgi:biotin transport system substrate-specific component
LTAVSARSLWWQAALALGGSLLVALAAQTAVYLPGAPVPISLQALAVLLVGAALGARLGAASLALYWLEGVAGLPVFAGGASGPLIACGPTGGYLVGFIAAAYVMGKATDCDFARTRVRQFASALAGMLVILSAGALWLALLGGPVAAWQAGVVPFLLGAGVKVALVTALLPAVRALRAR